MEKSNIQLQDLSIPTKESESYRQAIFATKLIVLAERNGIWGVYTSGTCPHDELSAAASFIDNIRENI